MKKIMMSFAMAIVAIMSATSVFAQNAITIDEIKQVSSDYKDGISTIKIVMYMSSGETIEQEISCELKYSKLEQTPLFEDNIVAMYECGYSICSGFNGKWEYHRYGEYKPNEVATISPLKKEFPADQKDKKENSVILGSMILVEPLRIKKPSPVYLKKRNR